MLAGVEGMAAALGGKGVLNCLKKKSIEHGTAGGAAAGAAEVFERLCDSTSILSVALSSKLLVASTVAVLLCGCDRHGYHRVIFKGSVVKCGAIPNVAVTRPG